MTRLTFLVCSVGWALPSTSLNAAPPPKFVAVDYARVARRIVKEPKYNAQPRYGLFIFDPLGKFRVWAVFDKSKSAVSDKSQAADSSHYDILYFDKNGDGDLTSREERFVARFDEKNKELTFDVGALKVLGTDLVHTKLKFITRNRHQYKGFAFLMNWNGKVHVEGGLRGSGTDLTHYSKSVKDAPVLRPTTKGPLGFVVAEKIVLSVSGAKTQDVQLMIGSRGSGPDTLCALSEDFLIPGKDRIFVTLTAKDAAGKVVSARSEIKQHC